MECQQSSAFRELLAVLYALQAFAPFLTGKRVLLYTDSQNCEAITDHGSSKPHLQALALRIFWLCKSIRLELQVAWIPRSANAQADYLSKFVDADHWRLNAACFQRLDALWGPHTIDRFASHLNAQLPRFNSRFWCPGTAGVDAFSQNWHWHGEVNWCCPPFRLVGHLLRFLQLHHCTATVVLPLWRSAVWWPLLCPTGDVCASFVKAVERLPGTTSTLFAPGMGSAGLYTPTLPDWPVIAVRIDCSGN